MTPIAFNKHVIKLFERIAKKLSQKNADYSNSSLDALKNFKLCELYGDVDMLDGIYTRISDKFARLSNLLHRDPAVTDESLEDTILDLIGYLAIFHAANTERNKS